MKCNGEDINLPSFIHRVIQAAYGLIACERISLYLVDAVKRELWMAVSKVRSVGLGCFAGGLGVCVRLRQDVEGIRIPFGQGIAGAVAVHGDVINIAGLAPKSTRCCERASFR